MSKRLLAAGLTCSSLDLVGGGGGGSSASSGSSRQYNPSNSQPAFSEILSVVENNTVAGTIEADDADSNDTLALSIEGGQMPISLSWVFVMLAAVRVTHWFQSSTQF